MARSFVPAKSLGFNFGTRVERKDDLAGRSRFRSRSGTHRGRSRARADFPPLIMGGGSTGGNEFGKAQASAWNTSLVSDLKKSRASKALKFFETNPKGPDEDPYIIMPSDAVARETKI